MGGLGLVWNFMTRTQPNPPSPKNRPNLVGWVGSGRFWRVGGLATHPYYYPPIYFVYK